MKLATIFVIVCVVKSIDGCRRPPATSDVTKPPGVRDWSVWNISPDNEDWEGFVDLLGTREIIKNKTKSSVSDDESIKESPGFPVSWMGLGSGSPGQDPPNNAKVVGYVGQAAYCLDPAEKGNGTTLWYLRWYYDHVRERCRRFVYSGIGGNANRFITKRTCEKNCKDPPRPCCVADTMFDFERFLDPNGTQTFS